MKTLIKKSLFLLLWMVSLPVLALDNQWYLGIGAGSSFLSPSPLDDSIDDIGNTPGYSTVFLGRDLDRFLSLQFQAGTLGDAELSNGELITYTLADASLIYWLYDSRDMGINPDGFGVAIYGKASFGAIDREIGRALPLEIDSNFFFGGGLGAELFLWGPLSLRMEAVYIERDAQFGSLSLVARFGGSGGSERPPVAIGQPAVPATSQVPGVPDVSNLQPSGGLDSDQDGVSDSLDACPTSVSGYPVKDNGCPLLNGVLTGVTFVPGSGTLETSSFAQLDYLANLLKRYSSTRVQIRAHTDTTGTPRDQAIITRARLRTLGTYLVRQSVSANRLVLRSLGGNQPAYDNATAEGRAANNRIEVVEQP